MRTFITAGTLFTPLQAVENGAVLVEDGKIISCGPLEPIGIPADAQRFDFPDATLAPGFIDIHIHGAAGHDSMHIGAEGFRKLGSFLARHGITSYLPTTITASEDDTYQALQWLADGIEVPARGDIEKPCAIPIGIHMEGPFISHARCGVHPSMHLLPPSVEQFERFCHAARNKVRLLTVAPELPGALELIRAAVERGVTVALGHSNATMEQALAGVEAGAKHSTHTFNAMRPLEHRDPGIVGVVLSEQGVFADIIADGLHVLPPVINIFLRSKGPERAVLISDGTSATGMPPGRYRLGAFEVEVDGLRCDSHGKLAGSVLTLDVAVQNVMKYSGCSLQDAIRLVTLNPATLLGIEKHKGRLAEGNDADFVVLSPEGEVLRTFIGGQGI